MPLSPAVRSRGKRLDTQTTIPTGGSTSYPIVSAFAEGVSQTFRHLTFTQGSANENTARVTRIGRFGFRRFGCRLPFGWNADARRLRRSSGGKGCNKRIGASLGCNL